MNELLPPETMGRADRLTIEAGTPGIVLMERAGRAVADAVAFSHPLGSRVLVVAGPGNNGGDGYIAARILRDRGYRVDVWSLVPTAKLTDDAAIAAQPWADVVVSADLQALKAQLSRAAVIVDALFGAGLARDLDGLAADVVRAINASGLPVIAVDLPSGIDGLTGAVRGVAITAASSVTFFRKKPGHLLLPGRAYCGPVAVADIGIGDWVLRELGVDIFANAPDLWIDALQPPTTAGQKYTRGHAVIVSGGMLTTGAARMAAIAALRAGAGLVTVASPPDALLVNACQLTAVMVKRMDGAAGLTDILTDARLNAVLIGPGAGVGDETAAMVTAILGRPGAAVLDADALTSFKDAPDTLFAANHAQGGHVVMTPHEGEFARIFPDLGEHTCAPKLARTREAARRSGAVVILKGADTVIAAPDGRAAINANAPADLATAGSGDTLAGIVTGLLARGLTPFEAASAGVWIHGETGRLAGAGLIAEDLAGQIPRVLTDLYDLKARLRLKAADRASDFVVGGSD
jgi:hydroxyethylthiazole kinase-like uncharacterized protein yjeF